jgi:uncharacterized protein YukE
MPIAGADLTELSGLVTRLAGREREELAGTLDKMNAAVQDSAAWWIGEYADRFRRDFTTFVATTRRDLDQVLDQAARVTRQNLRAIASATGDGTGQQAASPATGSADAQSLGTGHLVLAGDTRPLSFADSSPGDTRGVPELGAAAYAGFYTSTQAWFRSTRVLWRSPQVLHDHAWGGPTRSGPPHAPDFGSSSDQEYAKQAYQFFQDAGPKGYEVKVAGSTFRVFDPATNSFGAYGADGTVKTFFKPTNPSYWNNPSYGSAPAAGDLDVAAGNAAAHIDAEASWFSRVGRLMDTPAGRAGGKVLGVLGVAGDVFTIAEPSPDALGGASTERIMAAANLGAMALTAGPIAGLLAANAALDWVPVAGEVVMAATALYFVGDLVYENRAAIGHALSWTGHEIVHVGSDVVHGLASGASHAWHSIFG